GTKAHCLLDSGCEGIMISSDFMRANKLPKFELENPVILQLACMGSMSTVQYGLTTKILLGKEKYDEYFNIANVNYYDIILGTPCLHWFEILLDFKNNCVQMGKLRFTNRFGSITPTKADENEAYIPLELPPFREVNHEINLIDPSQVICYRTPRCPGALKEQNFDKINQYVTARWRRQVSTQQAVPMLCLPKKTGKLKTLFDKCLQNENTVIYLIMILGSLTEKPKPSMTLVRTTTGMVC
ncbi:hypothetical protein M422DRAFT_179812, partial [Sphaerobolus stellatus SS14]